MTPLLLLALLAAPAQEQTIEEHLATQVQETPAPPEKAPEHKAQEPLLSASSANGDPFSVSATAGGMVTFGADSPSEVTPTAFLEAEGPLIVGNNPLGRIGARLGLTTAPGEAINLSDPTTFRAGDVGFWAGRIIGRRTTDSQDIETSVLFEWGFSSRIDKGQVQPLTRLIRHYGGGLRFRERISGASLTALYGRDQAAGDFGYGQWMLWGDLPVPATKGTIVLQADATLSVGPVRVGAVQRDIFRVGVVVDLGAVVSEIGK